MPFQSDKQRKYLYSQKPEVAKKFAAHGKEQSYADAIRKRKTSGSSDASIGGGS